MYSKMRWLAMSLIIGTVLGLIIRYDLNLNNRNLAHRMNFPSSKHSLVNMKLSCENGLDINLTQKDRPDGFLIYVELYNRVDIIQKVNEYFNDVHRLSGIETTHELMEYGSFIYWSIYGSYHRYTIRGSDIKRNMLILNDVYEILNGKSVDVNVGHLGFTALEQWCIRTSNNTLYSFCSECSYDVILYNKVRSSCMVYSRQIDRRKERVHVERSEIENMNYRLIFEDENNVVFMLFGNGQWYLDNENCERKLVEWYSNQLGEALDVRV